jgi:hypothetical protein
MQMTLNRQKTDLVPCESSVLKAGDRYGRYTVIGVFKKAGGYQKYASVKCDCGSAARHIQVGVLRNGTSQSCGCLHKERVTKHGLWQTPVFKCWKSMIDRCTNPKDKAYRRYGARGITVCKEWLDLANFVADMGPTFQPGLTLDRKNNDGPYTPENCRWATRKEQNRNYSRNVLLTLNGETHCLKEWAEITGINYGTLADRIRVQKLPAHLALRT